MKLKCSTCSANLMGHEDFVKFSCPECGGETIIRCARCRKLCNPYKCSKCGFEGP